MAKKTTQAQANEICHQFDTSVGRFADAIAEMTSHVAVHSERLDTIDESFAKLDRRHDQILARIDEHTREEQKDMHASAEKVVQQNKELAAHFETIIADWKQEGKVEYAGIARRLTSLEKWRNLILGGCAVLALALELAHLWAEWHTVGGALLKP